MNFKQYSQVCFREMFDTFNLTPVSSKACLENIPVPKLKPGSISCNTETAINHSSSLFPISSTTNTNRDNTSKQLSHSSVLQYILDVLLALQPHTMCISFPKPESEPAIPEPLIKHTKAVRSFFETPSLNNAEGSELGLFQ